MRVEEVVHEIIVYARRAFVLDSTWGGKRITKFENRPYGARLTLEDGEIVLLLDMPEGATRG